MDVGLIVSEDERARIELLMARLVYIYSLCGFSAAAIQNKIEGRHIIFDKHVIKRLGTITLTVFEVVTTNVQSLSFELLFDRNDYGDEHFSLGGRPVKAVRISMAGSDYRQCTMEINLVRPLHYQRVDFVYYLRSDQGQLRLGAPWLDAESQIATTEALEIVEEFELLLKKD